MGLKRDLEGKLTYDSYLKTTELLSLQVEESDPKHHDEMLFIIIHQVYELWFKLIIHECHRAIEHLNADRPMMLLKSLKRIDAIMDTLIGQVDVLETMSPSEFAGFRERLNPASGFQSHQFRVVEFMLGIKNPSYIEFHKHRPEIVELLNRTMAAPSLYDHVLHYLKRNGWAIPDRVLTRDVSESYDSTEAVIDVIAQIYADPETHSDLYLLCESLVDIDEKLMLWRGRHVKMVERMIGNKMGTGGSSGAAYLRTTMVKRAFPELWDVRDRIGRY